MRTGLATLASLACTWYVPGRADDATVTQPGRLMVRFQLSDSWAGTPRRSDRHPAGWHRLARVVVVTISILIHTESMQAAVGGDG